MEIYDYYKLAAQQQGTNLAKNMIIKLEIYMTGTEESTKKKNKSESKRGSIASEAKEIHSSGALKSFKLVLEKCEKQSSREKEREWGNNPITTQQETTTNELIMLQVKAKQQMKWKLRGEKRRGGKNCCGSNQVEPSRKRKPSAWRLEMGIIKMLSLNKLTEKNRTTT